MWVSKVIGGTASSLDGLFHGKYHQNFLLMGKSTISMEGLSHIYYFETTKQ
jgi:hypothetical protein